MSYTPLQPDKYSGKQVLINSDRLIFNAKDDSILLFANKAVGFSTNGSFHFDTGEGEDSKFVINAPKMYFGLTDDGNLATEPALLGNATEIWLTDLLDLIGQILVDYQTGKLNQLGNLGAVTTPSPSAIGTTMERLNGEGGVNDLKIRIKEIKSKQINLI